MDIIVEEMAIEMVRRNTEAMLAKIREKWIVPLGASYSRYDNFLLGTFAYGYENEDVGYLMAISIDALTKKFSSVNVVYDLGDNSLSVTQRSNNYEQTYSITIETQEELDALMCGQFLNLVAEKMSP